MGNELVRSTINPDLVTKQILSQIMLDSMKMESQVEIPELSGDLALKSLAYYSQELACGECLEQLLSSSEFMETIHEQEQSQWNKGRLAYLNINSEPSKNYVLSRKS